MKDWKGERDGVLIRGFGYGYDLVCYAGPGSGGVLITFHANLGLKACEILQTPHSLCMLLAARQVSTAEIPASHDKAAQGRRKEPATDIICTC